MEPLTRALLHDRTKAVVVNREGTKYPSELPSDIALFFTKRYTWLLENKLL